MSPDDPFDTAYLQRNLGRLAARGGLVLVAGQAVQFLLSVATTIVLARLLVPEDFGLVAMAAPFIGFLAFFRDSGLHMATVQRDTINHRQISTLFWFNLALGFVLMVVLAVSAPAIARFFGRDELVGITLAYAVNMLIGGASIQHAALLTRRMAFGKLSAAAIASQSFGLAVAVATAWDGLAYGSLVAMAIATTVVQTLLVWYFSGWTPGLPRRGTGIVKMLAFGGGLTVSNLVNQATQYVDSILIGRMLGAAPLGFYDRGKQLFVMPLIQLIGPLANVSIPTLSRLSETPERYAQVYLRIQEKLLLATALFSAILLVYGDALVVLLLGSKWSLVGPIVQAFAVGGFVGPISLSLAWLLVTQGRSRELAYWSPYSLMFRCAAILCGYPWGIFGIAVSIAAFQYLSFVAFALWVGRAGPVRFAMVVRNMVLPTSAGLLSCLAGFLAKLALKGSSLIVTLSVGAMISGLAFIAVLWLIPAGKLALLDLWRMGRTAMSHARPADARS